MEDILGALIVMAVIFVGVPTLIGLTVLYFVTKYGRRPAPTPTATAGGVDIVLEGAGGERIYAMPMVLHPHSAAPAAGPWPRSEDVGTAAWESFMRNRLDEMAARVAGRVQSLRARNETARVRLVLTEPSSGLGAADPALRQPVAWRGATAPFLQHIESLGPVVVELWSPPADEAASAVAEPPSRVRSSGDLAVELTTVGPHKIPVIKEVRLATDLGLKEAKDLVESAPQVLLSGIGRAEAEAIQASFRRAGASVTIRPAQESPVRSE